MKLLILSVILTCSMSLFAQTSETAPIDPTLNHEAASMDNSATGAIQKPTHEQKKSAHKITKSKDKTKKHAGKKAKKKNKNKKVQS